MLPPAHAHAFRFLTRPLTLALSATLALPVVAEVKAADSSVTENRAAESAGVLRDWRPYAELPEGERQDIAPYCPGGFVDPMRLDDSIDPSRPDEEFPLVFHFDESDNLSTDSVHLSGDVSAKRNAFEVYADEIRYESSSGQGELEGQVRLRSLGALIAGESALLDFDTDEATINNAEFALHREDLHGSAQTLHRQTLSQFRGENIAITRCMPEDPAWGIRAASLTVNQQTGIARAWHARFEIKSVPVLYVPYLSFPIDERRRSGFLPGTYGLGEGGVTELAVPYYLNLAPNYDDTFTLHYFGELGLLARNEFRFLTEEHSGITDLDVQVAGPIASGWPAS
jgi:LPS-assembly protein